MAYYTAWESLGQQTKPGSQISTFFSRVQLKSLGKRLAEDEDPREKYNNSIKEDSH